MAETRSEEAQFDVFISHAKADAAEWSERLAENLRELGLKVWFDSWEIEPGGVFVADIEKGLSQSNSGVLVVSQAALESEWVREEYAVLLKNAVERGRRLIPVLLGDVPLPSFLEIRQWVDFRGADGSVYEDKVRELAAALRGEGPSRPAPTGELRGPPGSKARVEGSYLRTLVISPDEVRLLGGNDEVQDDVDPPDSSLKTKLWELARARKRAGHEEAPKRAVLEAEAPPEVSKLHKALLDAGGALGKRYLSGSVGKALVAVVAEAKGARAALELAVRVTDPLFAGFPWETLCLPGPAKTFDQPLSLHSGVHLYRSVEPKGPVNAVSIPGPLRILVAIGSPENQNKPGELLDYEAELERILDSVDPARQKGEAHVRILHRGTVKAIRQALEEERFHVLYVSCHAGPGVLILEDEEGEVDKVDAERLIEHLPENLCPALVVLAGCATARGQWEVVEVPKLGDSSDREATDEEPGAKALQASFLPGLAESLLSGGVPAVIAMQAPVGDVYARRLGAQLFGNLAGSQVKEPLRALTIARRDLEKKRRNNPDKWDQAEWATPSLYLPETGPTTRASRPLFSADRDTWETIERPDEPTFAEGVVHRREGFVGRRREERLARKALLGDKKSGVLIHGLGGVGKSTLAAELLARLRGDHLVVSVYKETQPDSLLAAVGAQLLQLALASGVAEDHPLRQTSGVLQRQEHPWEQRFELLVGRVLNQIPLLLLIDNFEDNLVGLDDGWEVQDPHLAQLLVSWLRRPGKSRILITSRYPFALPDEAENRLERFHLGPLSLAETRKLFWRLPQLDALDREQQEKAYAVVGGHPRTLEYLDALLAGGEARFPDVEEKLRKTLSKVVKKPEAWLAKTKGNLDQALAEVVTVAVQDVVLEDLLARLDDHPLARQLLFRASVYRLPVDSIGLVWQVSEEVEVEEDPEREERRKDYNERAREARKEGKELTAETLGYSEQEWQQLEEDERQLLAPPLADVPEALGPAVGRLLELGLLAPGGQNQFIVHRWTADALGRLDETGDVEEGHRRAARCWRWRVKVVPQDRMQDVHQLLEARWHHREAGETDEAVEVTEWVANQLDTWGAYRWEAQLCREVLEWVPERAAKAAGFLHQLGIIAQKQGSYEEALSWYRKSLKILEDLGDRSGIASSYHQLGIVSQERGSYDEALSWYRKSLEIIEELGNRSGMASSYHQLGRVSQSQGSYDEALSWYRKSLEISEELGDRSGLASSYHQLGTVSNLKGSYDEALSWYRKSLEIKEELGDRSGLASSYHQLGVMSQLRGSYDEALSWYRKSLEISEELGNRSEMATTISQMGVLATETGSPEDGVARQLQALGIRIQLGVPEIRIDLNWLTRQEDLLGQDRFREILDEHLGEENRDAVLGLMEQYRQAQRAAEAEAG